MCTYIRMCTASVDVFMHVQVYVHANGYEPHDRSRCRSIAFIVQSGKPVGQLGGQLDGQNQTVRTNSFVRSFVRSFIHSFQGPLFVVLLCPQTPPSRPSVQASAMCLMSPGLSAEMYLGTHLMPPHAYIHIHAHTLPFP
jgi:hypothetical protein